MIDVQTVSAQAYEVRDKPAPSHHSGLACHLRTDTWTRNTAAALLVLACYGPCIPDKVIQSCTPATAGRAELPQLHSSLAVICHPCTQPLELALTDLILLKHGWSKAWEERHSYGKAESLQPFFGSKICLRDIWDDVRPSGHLLGGI